MHFKKTATDTVQTKSAQVQDQKGQRPSIDDIFKMDTNNDGLLSKKEVNGPLEREFDNIDTNGDGYISKEELTNAPKPERGQRPSRN